MAAWKTPSAHSDKRKSWIYWWDSGYDQQQSPPPPLRSTVSIARNMGVSEFLIEQVVHDMIFLMQDEIGSIFMPNHQRQVEKVLCEAFKQTQSSTSYNRTFFGFSQRKISARTQNNHRIVSTKSVLQVIRVKHPVSILVFEGITSDGNVVLPSSHTVLDSTQKPTSSVGKR